MQYLARITIHDGTYAEYKDLHERMRTAGFHRYIRNAAGRYFLLPDATYVGESHEGNKTVHARIARVAATAAPSKGAPQVFVCQYGEAVWTGLTVAK